MLDISHIPSMYPNADVQTFVATDRTTTNLFKWVKPRGKSMAYIVLIGAGGNGGNGVIGANSLAGGGGGGASGGVTSVRIPLSVIPDTLDINLSIVGDSYINIPSGTDSSENRLVYAAKGGNGGNASGATAGAAGTAGLAVNAGFMPRGWQWLVNTISGQNGGAGGGTGAAGAFSIPTTGLIVTGGTGGGGLPAAAGVGTQGGAITGAGALPTVTQSTGGSTATTPPRNGSDGFIPVQGLTYFYGGTGGGSTHGSATGAGLVQSSGGKGAIGCGGGGSGGALTGSTSGTAGLGGPSCCIITCW
jgi:hypothetical protein